MIQAEKNGSGCAVRCARLSGLFERGLSCAAGPYGDTRLGSMSVEWSRSPCGLNWFARSRLVNRLPLPSDALPAVPITSRSRSGGGGKLTALLLRHQRLGDARRLVGQCHRNHPDRLARQYPA